LIEVLRRGAIETWLKAEVDGTVLNCDGLDKDYRWLYEIKASGETES
jgi:hypothetical protein